MIALLTACLFFEILVGPCARAELHQRKRALKLCSATLSKPRRRRQRERQSPNKRFNEQNNSCARVL